MNQLFNKSKYYKNLNGAIEICLNKLIKTKVLEVKDKPQLLFKLIDIFQVRQEYCERLIKLNESNEYDFTNDLLHDISGFIRKDENFLPRI